MRLIRSSLSVLLLFTAVARTNATARFKVKLTLEEEEIGFTELALACCCSGPDRSPPAHLVETIRVGLETFLKTHHFECEVEAGRRIESEAWRYPLRPKRPCERFVLNFDEFRDADAAALPADATRAANVLKALIGRRSSLTEEGGKVSFKGLDSSLNPPLETIHYFSVDVSLEPPEHETVLLGSGGAWNHSDRQPPEESPASRPSPSTTDKSKSPRERVLLLDLLAKTGPAPRPVELSSCLAADIHDQIDPPRITLPPAGNGVETQGQTRTGEA